MKANTSSQHGLTLLEMLFVVAISGIIMATLGEVIIRALQAEDQNRAKNELMQEARFAMQRMVASVRGSKRLLIPFGDNPATTWSESVRDVLAVTLDPTIDRDGDGWADANNDKDYQDLNNNAVRDPGEWERIDEDLDGDNTNDDAHGIIGIDDNGDGSFDGAGRYIPADNETIWHDNDESSLTQPPAAGDEAEDILNGIDDDGDGAIDEDISDDMNGDGQPGIANVDDDNDGTTDELGGPGDWGPDDDEDGFRNDDWFDPVVYYLNGSQLIERLPSLTDTNGDSSVTGADFIENPIVDNVTEFVVSLISQGSGNATLISISLGLMNADGDTVKLQARIRLDDKPQ